MNIYKNQSPSRVKTSQKLKHEKRIHDDSSKKYKKRNNVIYMKKALIHNATEEWRRETNGKAYGVLRRSTA